VMTSVSMGRVSGIMHQRQATALAWSSGSATPQRAWPRHDSYWTIRSSVADLGNDRRVAWPTASQCSHDCASNELASSLLRLPSERVAIVAIAPIAARPCLRSCHRQ
jgi:hypothetical protein